MKYSIPCLVILLFFSSCKDNSDNNLIVFRVAEEGLQRSNKNISLSTNLVYHRIQEKTQAPETSEVALRWQPVTNEIKKLSGNIVKYIDSLKEELKNEAGGYGAENKDWENTMGVSEHLFESQGKGKDLLRELIKYKASLLALNPEVKNQFEHDTNIFSNEFTFNATDTTSFIKTFFGNIPVIAAHIMLSKFVNNVKICENEFINYCYNKIGFVDGPSMYEKFAAIVGQSSNYIKAGDELLITAGVGSFSSVSQPKITINGIEVIVNEDAVAVHKLKTSKRAGKHFVPVKIEYTKPNGNRDTKIINIEYTVIEENQNPQ